MDGLYPSNNRRHSGRELEPNKAHLRDRVEVIEVSLSVYICVMARTITEWVKYDEICLRFYGVIAELTILV